MGDKKVKKKVKKGVNQAVIALDLLEILVCPDCRKPIELVEYRQGLFGLKCIRCLGVYPIRDGIPIMLSSEKIKI